MDFNIEELEELYQKSAKKYEALVRAANTTSQESIWSKLERLDVLRKKLRKLIDSGNTPQVAKKDTDNRWDSVYLNECITQICRERRIPTFETVKEIVTKAAKTKSSTETSDSINKSALIVWERIKEPMNERRVTKMTNTLDEICLLDEDDFVDKNPKKRTRNAQNPSAKPERISSSTKVKRSSIRKKSGEKNLREPKSVISEKSPSKETTQLTSVKSGQATRSKVRNKRPRMEPIPNNTELPKNTCDYEMDQSLGFYRLVMAEFKF